MKLILVDIDLDFFFYEVWEIIIISYIKNLYKMLIK